MLIWYRAQAPEAPPRFPELPSRAPVLSKPGGASAFEGWSGRQSCSAILVCMSDSAGATPFSEEPDPGGVPAGRPVQRGPAVVLTRPYVTWTIIAITFFFFLLQFFPPLQLQSRFAFAPMLAHEEPWRALTAALVHAQPNPSHVLFNMLGLFFFGSFVERSMGHVFMLVTYVIGAFGGSVLTLVLAAPGTPEFSSAYVGASGAVFAVVGTLLAPTSRLDRNLMGIVLFLCLNMALVTVDSNIAWQAHLGGLAVGFVLGVARVMPRGAGILAKRYVRGGIGVEPTPAVPASSSSARGVFWAGAVLTTVVLVAAYAVV